MFFSLLRTRNIKTKEDIFKNGIKGLEKWCIAFNNFFIILCTYLKFIIVFIILFVGILTLLRLRGVYRQSRLMGIKNEEDSFKIPRLILGILYVFLAFGILFNYVIYFLIWILDPLPDKLIYNFIDFSGIDPFYSNRIQDISAFQFPYEKTVYYCFAIGSLISVLNILLSLWYLINNNRLINNPSKVLVVLISGIIGGVLFGFTTGLSFLL
ncbi:MAG: hypothetical protein ACFFB0_16960 [Promethearchaeota archaeon]